MENITSLQKGLVEKLLKNDKNVVIHWDEARGMAASISATIKPEKSKPVDHAAIADKFILDYGPLFGPEKIKKTLKQVRNEQDSIGYRHFEWQHYVDAAKDSYPVYGAKLMVHVSPEGVITSAESSCWRDTKTKAGIIIDESALKALLNDAIVTIEGYDDLVQKQNNIGKKLFPLITEPTLVVYPWKRELRLTWTAYSYVPDRKGNESVGIRPARVFIDAHNGEKLYDSFTSLNQIAGKGLSVLPLGGPYTERDLIVEKVSTKFYLQNKSHNGTGGGRDILTYDLNGSSIGMDQMAVDMLSDNLKSSEDGDSKWDRTVRTTTRIDSQQPETDLHYYMEQLYRWYDALDGSGRKGWDNDRFPAVGPQKVRGLVHTRDPVSGSTESSAGSFTAYPFMTSTGPKWNTFIQFSDGNPAWDCTSPASCPDRNNCQHKGIMARDYPSGAATTVGHEYDHGIVFYSFTDPNGDPGLMFDGTDFKSWQWGLYEGLADAFGCMFARCWKMGSETSAKGGVIRNLEYPPDMSTYDNRPYFSSRKCGLGHHNLDHFDDRFNSYPDNTYNTNTFNQEGYLKTQCSYDFGTILAHCAFLLTEGGLHRRPLRGQEHIQVKPLGDAIVKDISVPNAARVFYRALRYHAATIWPYTGASMDDQEIFRRFRDMCVEAARELFDTDLDGKSAELETVKLAFYVVGLHPNGTYGADLMFIGNSKQWKLSAPYAAISSPAYSSIDLFIDNGSGVKWDGMFNVESPFHQPRPRKKIENSVFCRVRNIGDRRANDVRVEFYYRVLGPRRPPLGMSESIEGIVLNKWYPVKDANGNVQALHFNMIEKDTSGSNYSSDQESASILPDKISWYLPDLRIKTNDDEQIFIPRLKFRTVELKAVMTCADDVNPGNNMVISRIRCLPF